MDRWVEERNTLSWGSRRLCWQDPAQHAGRSCPLPTSIVAHFTLRPASVSPLGEPACLRLRDQGCGVGSRIRGNRRGAGAGRGAREWAAGAASPLGPGGSARLSGGRGLEAAERSSPPPLPLTVKFSYRRAGPDRPLVRWRYLLHRAGSLRGSEPRDLDSRVS